MSTKLEKELLLHKICNGVKRRKRLISIATWNIEDKDIKFKKETKENYVYFMINAIMNFGIDIMILFDANFSGRLHWNGYNYMKIDHITILWTQCIVIRPEKIDNKIIVIKELKIVISLNKNYKELGIKYNMSDEQITNDLSKIELDCMRHTKPDYMLIGIYNDKTIAAVVKDIKKRYVLGMNKSEVNIFGREINGIKTISVPYGLDIIHYFQIFRVVESSLGVKLKKIKSKDTISDIIKILDGETPSATPVVKKSFYWNKLVGEYNTMSHIIGNVMYNQLGPIYRKWNGLWTGFRKEPFLGPIIPDSVIFSYKCLLIDDKDKKYFTVDIPKYVDVGTFNKEDLRNIFKIERGGYKESDRLKLLLDKIVISKSEAGNFDLYEIKDIVKGIRKWFKREGKEAVAGKLDNQKKIRMLLTNIINMINSNARQYMVTFFLVKNFKLSTADHTRMIAIAPTLIKIFEVLIYKDVTESSYKIMDNQDNRFEWGYQYGARANSSTTKAMVELRGNVEGFRAEGFITMDITKGYESVNLRKLILAVKYFVGDSNLRLRFLLLSWISFIHNLDIIVSGTVIRKSKGIPMGLMLSPLMFIIYVHYLFKDLSIFQRSHLIMYIDDIMLILPRNVDEANADPIKYINTIVNALNRGDLFINWNKSCLVSRVDYLVNNIKKEFPFIHIEDHVKYLGREIILKGEFLLPVDPDVKIGLSKVLRQIPDWSPLIVKLSIFNGGLEGKARYQSLMWEVSIICRRNLFTRAKIFYTPSFEILDEFQMIFILGNYFRLGFNAYMVKDWMYKDDFDKRNWSMVTAELIKERMNIIKGALLFDIPVLDNIVKKYFDNWLEYRVIARIMGEVSDYWTVWKIMTKKIWFEYRQMVLFKYWASKVGEENINDWSFENENCFSWNKLFSWLLGIIGDYDEVYEISIIRRYSLLLDMVFKKCYDDRLLLLVYSINIQLNDIFVYILRDEDLRIDLNKVQVLDIDEDNTIIQFISIIVMLNVICKNWLAKIKGTRWKEIVSFTGEGLSMIIGSLNNDLASVEYTLDNIEERKSLIRKKLKRIFKTLRVNMLVLDSIYKYKKFDGKDVFFIASYCEIMKIIYKEELDKQGELFDIVDFQLDDNDKIVIDLDIDIDYIQDKIDNS